MPLGRGPPPEPVADSPDSPPSRDFAFTLASKACSKALKSESHLRPAVFKPDGCKDVGDTVAQLRQ